MENTKYPPSHEELQKMKASREFDGPLPTLKTESEAKTHNIIWDLSSQLGEARHKIKMLEWKLDEMKKIIND